ncbi:citrate synthase [Vibrio maritimus]|uniref:Citrate synthase n=1 Tax=Vibrio maritimus TaxID=990268 RepID=A0A090TA88_9VIBR|nr:citrate synthase [Vibrio maritimus]
MADKKATLHIEGQAPIELPIMEGSIGPEVVDVRKLGANGYFTFDQVFLPLHLVNLKSLISTAAKVFYCTAASLSIS